MLSRHCHGCQKSKSKVLGMTPTLYVTSLRKAVLSRQSGDPALSSVDASLRFCSSLTVIARLGKGLLLSVAVFAGLSGRQDLIGLLFGLPVGPLSRALTAI
jgi:hypothetical protein